MQSPLELQKHMIKHTLSPPLQHCTQPCNTNAALHAIMQYQCSIACNHAIPMRHCTQSCNTNAAVHAAMQSQCNQPCTPSAAVYAPPRQKEIYIINYVYFLKHFISIFIAIAVNMFVCTGIQNNGYLLHII